MKLLHINNFHYVRGGSDNVYFNTARMLEQAGHESVFFAAAHDDNLPDSHGAYFPPAVDTGRPAVSQVGRFLHNPQARRNLRRLIAEHGPFDLAHLHIYHGRLTPSILKPLREAGIPIIQSLHEYKLACPVYTMERGGQTCEACVTGSTLNVLRHRCKNGSLLHSAAALAEFWASRLQGDVRHIDRFICISDFQAGIMRRAGIPDAKLRRLHNFVDTARITPVPVETRARYLLYFGRIERLKGVPTLIEAVKTTGHHLKIAGSGHWQEEMTQAIRDCPNIEHLGFVHGEALDNLIRGARAVVVPSEWYEPFGLTVIEAKAAGTPVIGADIGGIPELIRDGVDGFLFRPGDRRSLGDALDRLARSDPAALSAAARADACARFSPDTHLHQLLDIYREVSAS